MAHDYGRGADRAEPAAAPGAARSRLRSTPLLALTRDFIVSEDDGSGAFAKKMAGYHQFHAVQTTVAETLRAARLQRRGVRMRAVRGLYESVRQPRTPPSSY